MQVVRPIIGGFMLVCALLAPTLRSSGADAPAPTEDQVKAAFLLNFPKYVEWSESAFTDSRSPIVLAVLGNKAVEKELRRMAAGKTFGQRRLEIRSVTSADDVGDDCRMLFVGSGDELRATPLLAGLGARGILTVGESEEFFEHGGMINLVRRDRKIRLEINLPPASQAGLKISSKLLGVAELVKR